MGEKKKIRITFKKDGMNITIKGTSSHQTLPLKIDGEVFKKTTPFIARLYKQTYSGIILISIDVKKSKCHQFKENSNKSYFLNLGNLPILLKSIKCSLNYAQAEKS